MSALENLPPDQRAVLQMVLQRGRSYDEIAALLSIERAAVRRRALDAFGTLAGSGVAPGPESALVTDYLLGQLPEKVAEQVYAYLQASEPDRAWAQAVAACVAPLGSGALPEIPVGAPLGADDGSAGELERHSDPIEPGPEPPASEAEVSHAAVTDVFEQPAPSAAAQDDDPWRRDGDRTRATRPGEPHRSSRRGGAILLSVIGVAIIAAVLIVALGSGGPAGSGKRQGAGVTTTPNRTARTTATSPSTSTAATTTTTAKPVLLAQLNLKSPNGASSTLGIAQVIRDQGVIGVAILAQGVPANTAHNAYAVWLYNSSSSFKFVGFVRNLVTKSGKLSAEGELPAGAAGYHTLLITLETQSKPSAPGEVVLSGPFREHP